jgi:hypothetical protein
MPRSIEQNLLHLRKIPWGMPFPLYIRKNQQTRSGMNTIYSGHCTMQYNTKKVQCFKVFFCSKGPKSFSKYWIRRWNRNRSAAICIQSLFRSSTTYTRLQSRLKVTRWVDCEWVSDISHLFARSQRHARAAVSFIPPLPYEWPSWTRIWYAWAPGACIVWGICLRWWESQLSSPEFSEW